ncbi:flavin monoamine oxidase family protein [Methylomonas sp. HYX-M1]|uniref:flavin monoamine oxidase family protein n=1 Tax=Methylomonas sp. HYX-M1 TaxID=3139307 RepID=UPI00345C0550
MAHSILFRKLVLALQAARRDYLESRQRPAPLPHTVLGWDRRRFVKTSVAAGIGGVLELSGIAPAFAGKPQPAARVAIIGAGIAGLNAAYRLRKAGIIATVYEARSRPGGRMLSVTIDDGLTVDLGAELINTDHLEMRALAKAFDIALFDRLKDAARTDIPEEAYFFDGLSYDAEHLAADIFALAAQISEDAALIDRDWERYAPFFDQLSVADYLNLHADKIRAGYVRVLFENAIRTEYGAEPADSSALQLLFLLPQVDGRSVEILGYSDEAFAVTGGSARLTDALAAALPGQIRYGKALHSLTHFGDGYQLTFADRSSESADIVIVAMPFPALRQVALNVRLPDLFRRFVNETGLGANEKLIAGFAERFWRNPAGFSLAAWTDMGFAAVWDESQRQPKRPNGALNFFLGGKQVERLNRSRDFKALGRQFIAELERVLPGAGDSATGTLLKSAWGRSRFTGGGYANFKPGQLTEFAEFFWVEAGPADAQQVVFDNLIFAGEQLSDAYYGFMEGGAQTGRLAAACALQIARNHA